MGTVEMFEKLDNIGWTTVAIVLLLVIALFPVIKDSWKKFLGAAGLIKEEELYKEAVQSNIKELRERVESQQKNLEQYQEDITNRQKEYHQQSITIRNNLAQNQENLSNAIVEIKDMIINKNIDDMRWEILSFANAIIGGRDYNKEQYDHVLEIYMKYEKTLSEVNMENGKVDMSMDFVKKKYAELLETGFKR